MLIEYSRLLARAKQTNDKRQHIYNIRDRFNRELISEEEANKLIRFELNDWFVFLSE